jgi:hypothetical protein
LSTRATDISRHNYATRRLYDPRKNPAIREFRGVDGEGGTVRDESMLFGERHQYLSLRSGPELLETGKPLHWKECFEFLLAQPAGHIDVAYFFDYDVTMMIRTMPEERARKLLNRHLRYNKEGGLMPLDIEGYQCDYLPHKEFKLRRKGDRAWVVISDTGQFFQGPFLSTLEKWDIGTPEERAMIAKGKSMRAEFTEFTEETRAYNALECVLLEQLMTDFRAVCEETGYVPKKWQGPGYLASAMLERHGVPKRDEIPILSNQSFRALAQAAYYGGRFETTVSGPVDSPVWQYDINGAYVHLLRTLPCLIHGSWTQVHEMPDPGRIWFGSVHFDHTAPRYLYNLPVRLRNGNIQYPKEGNGVYWSAELEAAQRAGTNVDFQGGWVYEPHCDCRWFHFVDDYYAERIRLGKSAKGYVLKLAGNSIYGKLAQSIGYAPWANPVWAGLITAGCRAMLTDAYSQHPDDCLMLATDGLFMRQPLNLPVSRDLGEWELTEHPDGMFIVQPGIYFLGEENEVKTRGVERGRIAGLRPLFETQFTKFISSHGVDHTVSVPVVNFITARQAIARNKWHIAGTWENTTRELSFDWSSKRKRGIAFHRDGMLRTIPHDGGPDVHSVPYDRIIGGQAVMPEGERYTDIGLAESARAAEQPDWVQPLFG